MTLGSKFQSLTYESHDHTTLSVRGVAFSVNDDLFDPCDPYVTFDPNLAIRHKMGWSIDACDQV